MAVQPLRVVIVDDEGAKRNPRDLLGLRARFRLQERRTSDGMRLSC
jgi:hypothetical protein